jgi:membrane protein required for colicin V production
MPAFDLAALQTHWIDLAMLAWLIVSMLVGLVRGLVYESFSLLGWAVAYFAAHWAVPLVAPRLPVGEPGSDTNHAAAFVCAYFAVLLAWGLATRLVRLLVRATPLDLPDRMLGAGFGVARGVLVLLAVATFVGLTPMAASAAWRQSQCAAWLNVALQGLKPLLPNDLSQYLPA